MFALENISLKSAQGVGCEVMLVLSKACALGPVFTRNVVVLAMLLFSNRSRFNIRNEHFCNLHHYATFSAGNPVMPLFRCINVIA